MCTFDLQRIFHEIQDLISLETFFDISFERLIDIHFIQCV